MKKFPVKYSIFVNLLLVFITLTLCAIIIYNVMIMIDNVFYSVAINVTFIIIAGLLLIYLLFIAIFSRYKLSDEKLYIYIGLIPLKISLNKIDQIIKYNEKQELFIRYVKNNNRRTHFVCIHFNFFQSFIDELLLLNPKINYISEE